jgi:3-oxoacyl-[acyl-carrier protein] reductase
MQIAGRNALVTGAGQGIGEASALMLAEQGAASVVIADIDAEALAGTAAAISAAGATPIIRVTDLSEPDAVVELLDAADAETGGLDIVHNNAGIMTGEPNFPDTDLARMVAVIQVNLIAMMVGTRKAIELMRKRGAGGVIVNTASVAAFAPMPMDPAYSASKAGIVNFTQSCKPVHEAFGIRVMAVCPAMVDTAIVPRDAEWLQPALKAVKMLQPSDIAAAVQGIIEDDSAAGEYVVVENQPAG